MKRSLLFSAFVFCLTFAVTGSAQVELAVNADASAAKAQKVQSYIVQLAGDPIVAYEGDIRGYKATAKRSIPTASTSRNMPGT